jgi:hypothetical protein
MKNLSAALSVMVLLVSNSVAASTGTINFQGAIVRSPCTIPAEAWMNYAQHPATYKMAREAAVDPSCAGPAATQSVGVSRYTPPAQLSTDQQDKPAQAIVTVVYY